MQAKLLASILRSRRFLIAALVALGAYVLLYLAAAQYLVAAPGETDSFFAFRLLPDWRELMFRQRAPFVFEPIGALHFGPFMLFVSIPNLVIAVALGLLVAANVAVSYFSFHALGLRGLRGLHSLIGTIPALISGMACCVPTLILVIGLQLTATLATVWSWLVPASALLLVGSLWWSLHRMPEQAQCEPASGQGRRNP